MNPILLLLVLFSRYLPFQPETARKIFDVHLHGTGDITAQVSALEQAGVYKAAISSSWELQNQYRDRPGIPILFGLMLPCPAGKVPYSLQSCYPDGKDAPPLEWVEKQVQLGRIQFIGEILSQYYGITPADSLLHPYYALAEKYGLPVGIHTGGAGPDHGSAFFKMEYGNPAYIQQLATRFPRLKIWLMHGGDQFYREAIAVMRQNSQVYADISVLCNPDIVPAERFSTFMKAFMEAGLGDRLMFGTDNGDIRKSITAVEQLPFLSKRQKANIFHRNAERFFGSGGATAAGPASRISLLQAQ